jgi:hypothetical protein
MENCEHVSVSHGVPALFVVLYTTKSTVYSSTCRVLCTRVHVVELKCIDLDLQLRVLVPVPAGDVGAARRAHVAGGRIGLGRRLPVQLYGRTYIYFGVGHARTKFTHILSIHDSIRIVTE